MNKSHAANNRTHSAIRSVIQASGESIDLEQMGRYLETLLASFDNQADREHEVVRDYLGKVIDGINDCLDAEDDERANRTPENRYIERSALDKAIDRVSA